MSLVREFGSQLELRRALAPTAIGDDGNTDGDIIDTARFPGGLTFFAGATAYTDGSYTLTAMHGDQANLSDAVAVTTEHIVGQTAPTAIAAASGTNRYKKLSLIATKRYVRPRVVAASTTTGATIQVLVAQGPDIVPENGVA